MEIRKYQKKGKKKWQCEDILLCEKSDDLVFCGIADGQSNKKYCREGAKIALDTAKDYMLREQDSLTDGRNNDRYNDEMQSELLCEIRKRIRDHAAGTGADMADYASTLCCILCNLVTKTFSCIHLGDGRIAGISKEKKIQTLSAPENGPIKNYTYLTTTDGAMSHVHFHFGDLHRFQHLILLSDGAERLFRTLRLNKILCDEILLRDEKSFPEYFREKNFTDDASIIILSDR